jgi:urease accessory protein
MPFLLAAYAQPRKLPDLDNDFDAQTPCPVGRRASVAQGRALLAVWERSLASGSPSTDHDIATEATTAAESLAGFSKLLRNPSAAAAAAREGPCSGRLGAVAGPNAHLAPLWGVLTRALGLPRFTAAYSFLFAHARATASAAVRAGAMGSYAAQGVLSGAWLREVVAELVAENLGRGPSRDESHGLLEVGQTVPILDLWVGRHEILYTRIFNS